MTRVPKQSKTPNADPAALAQQLNTAAREATGLGVLFGQAVAKRLGIAHADLECLDMILVRGRVTAGEIATASGLTTGAVTGLLDRLERAELVRRTRDTEDRRKVHVMAQPAALRATSTHYGSLEKKMNRLIASHSPEQLLLLIDFFSRSRDIIQGEIKRLEENR